MKILLNAKELREYREFRGLSLRDVESCCSVTNELINMIENGKKNLTDFNYKEIVDGINKAYALKKSGKLDEHKKSIANVGKETNENKNTEKTVKSKT